MIPLVLGVVWGPYILASIPATGVALAGWFTRTSHQARDKASEANDTAKTAVEVAAATHHDMAQTLGKPNGKGNVVKMLETTIEQNEAILAQNRMIVQQMVTNESLNQMAHSEMRERMSTLEGSQTALHAVISLLPPPHSGGS